MHPAEAEVKQGQPGGRKLKTPWKNSTEESTMFGLLSPVPGLAGSQHGYGTCW